MRNERPRVRDIGLTPGTLSPGQFNSITDIKGVRIGHETLILGDDVRTGVTAVLPHEGNLFQEKVPAAIFVENGFGKLAGSTQVNELGELETPILLTNTLCVPRVADALIDYMLSIPGNEEVISINPVVAETNDGFLNDIRNKRVGRDEVFRSLQTQRPELLMRDASVREPGHGLLDSKEELGLLRDCFLKILAGTVSASWFRQITRAS